MELLLADLPLAILMALIGALVFSLIGIVSGTDETATIAPLTLVVILLGVPPAGVWTFFFAAAVSKHMTHAIPTMLLGIPGDTMAVPLLDEARQMRALGLPHVALRKAVSAAIISAFIAVPTAMVFSFVLSPFSELIGDLAPWLFLVAAFGIGYASAGKWAGVFAIIPFAAIVLGLNAWLGSFDTSVSTSYFLGIATGPMLLDLLRAAVPLNRKEMARETPSRVYLAPVPEEQGEKKRSGWLPNPLRELDRTQKLATVSTSVVSSATFVFSPVAMTVLMGELAGSRIKQGYQRLTTVLAAKNGTTESTYIAEAMIPLIAFGLPLSPVSAGPAAPLFNAPPVFHTDAESGQHYNIADALTSWEFFGLALIGVIAAALIAYPFSMRYAHTAAKFVVSKVSHEAIIAAFVGLVVAVSLWESGILGLVVVLTVGLLSGLLIRVLRIHAGVLFMAYYVAILSVPGIMALFG